MNGDMIPSLILSIILLLFLTAAAQSDTISNINQTLSGNQTIVSSGGNFELGFFTPGNSSRYYVGIWYKKVSLQTVIWVANREDPILDISRAQLKILRGNLVLLNESQYVVWSTDSTAPAPSAEVVAVLLDTGNLVLQRSGSGGRSDNALWQSFENPSHVWMPGVKFGYNKRTGRRTIFTSWKNAEDPAPGLFSLEPVMNSTENVLRWNESQQYWTSGEWNGRIFSQLPEMALTKFYNFSFTNNANQSYFTYWILDPSVISMIIMDLSGQLKLSTWTDNTSWADWVQPGQQCDVYAYCGAFGVCSQSSSQPCSCLPGFKQTSEKDWSLRDYSGGCVRETNLQCVDDNNATSKGMMDKFLMQTNVKLPSYSQSMAVRSIGECESACLSNCSCSAYAIDNNDCLTWQGELLNIQQLSQGDGSGKTIYIRHSPSSSAFVENRTKKNNAVVIGTISGAVVIAVVILGIVGVLIRNLGRRQMTKTGEGFLVVFSYKDLQAATKNFSMKLGGGGFGSVFKGTLPDSTAIAVKKLESINQGEKQFRTEVSTIGTIQHTNLVKLRGFCLERGTKLLVYDYMECGSLNSHLFGVEKEKSLSWKVRYDIVLGVARGLAYLHEKCRECIIHCDIKPENILLDANFCPKVGDFGLAKLLGHDFSQVLTTLRGTRGYLAPEWLSGGSITAKVDVYSYGMMIFELVSGKRNTERMEDAEECVPTFFPYLVISALAEGGDGDLLGLVDQVLEGDVNVEELSKLCKIAGWCIQHDENIRPSMSQVLHILEGMADVNIPPVPRSLQLILAAKLEERVVFFDSCSPSNSAVKITSNSKTNTE